MYYCPFLSTNKEKIKCFSECAFYKWEENEGVCPFKNLDTIKISKLRNYACNFVEDDKELLYIKKYYEQQY